jgi:hypothetical protein
MSIGTYRNSMYRAWKLAETTARTYMKKNQPQSDLSEMVARNLLRASIRIIKLHILFRQTNGKHSYKDGDV